MSSYDGLALAAYGEPTLTQQTLANDIFKIVGAASQTGDFIVAKTSSGTERFVVEDGGNIVITSGLAADNLISATQASTPTGNAIQILNSSGSKVFQVNSSGAIRTMVLGTYAIASIASNASASYTVTGVTTDDGVVIIPLKTLATGDGVMSGFAQGANRVDIFAAGASVSANTVAIWAIRTVAN